MKQYQKVLIALAQDAKPNAKQNKLAKLAIESNDDVLKGLLERSARIYSYVLPPKATYRLVPEDKVGIIPQNHQEWQSMIRTSNDELRHYVEMRLSQGKPEWMVMAEKYGWRPPN